MTPLSPNRRSLEGEHFQVIVIGGGLNGVAIARECARTGRRTLLLEQNDFGSGGTAKSSRIVPGGLRQIENRNLSDGRALLREQNSLLTNYPHHVQAREFFLALSPNTKRSSLKVKSALWVHKQMQTSHMPRGSQVNPTRLHQMLPHWSLFSYEDAICAFPERLLAIWMAEAVQSGAIVRNYAQALAIDVRHGRAQGVLLRDQLTGHEERVTATWVVNATGPWVERLCQRSRIESRVPILSTFRSAQIVLPHVPGAPEVPIFFESGERQNLSLLPWNGQLLFGSIEAADRTDPSRVAPSMNDVDSLVATLQQMLPTLDFSRSDVRYAWTGLFSRPANNSDSDSCLIYDHAQNGAANLFSIIGGSITTALSTARDCASRCGSMRKDSELKSNSRSSDVLDDWMVELRDAARINEEAAASIAEWHGPRSLDIARLAASDARMRSSLCSHTEHIVAEAVDAYQSEFAINLADVLLRRVPVALGPCWSQSCGREAVSRIRAVMGWSEQQAAAELEAFEMERSSMICKSGPVRLQTLQTAAD